MRFRRLLPILVLISGAAAVPAGAAVERADVQAAADRLAEARREASALDAEFQAALEQEAALRDLLAELIGATQRVRGQAAAARQSAADRIDVIYMRAGTQVGAGLVVTDDVTEGWVRVVYAAALADADRELIAALEASERDLTRLEAGVDAAAAAQRRISAEREAAVGYAVDRLAAAEAEYHRVRSEWEWQEEERRRAATAATATTNAPPETTSTTEPAATTEPSAGTTEPDPGVGGGSTTITTVPAATTTLPDPVTTTTAAADPVTTTTTVPEPVTGGTFAAPVERWRPLVEQYFPAVMVDGALSVMSCESFGDPEAVNPSSGAAGLFQHLPKYWPERAEGAGFPGASPFEGEANIAATRWLVDRSLELDLDAWYFWTCKP
jgi:hypothetical protein